MRELIHYLPPYMREYKEIKALMAGEQTGAEYAWNAADSVLQNQFVHDAQELGIRRYEQIYSIAPRGTDTLEERKFRVIAVMNQELPYTLRNLRSVLDTLCGYENYAVELRAKDYHIEVKLALVSKTSYGDCESAILKMIPANLTYHIQIMYNAHGVFRSFTHEKLSRYTHDQLRNEVLS